MRRYSSNLAFVDLLFNLLVGFTSLFVIAFLLYEADSTLLTFVILGVTLVTSATMGLRSKKMVGQDNNMSWFLSDAVLSLGMVGTLFGFLLVLDSAFTEIDTSSTESMTEAIGVLASGMSTALVTSLVVLLSSLWLKLQLVVLEGLI